MRNISTNITILSIFEVYLIIIYINQRMEYVQINFKEKSMNPEQIYAFFYESMKKGKNLWL